MVRVHGQVMGRILWKWKSMFQIIFRLLPAVLPHGNNLLPLKIHTHPQRDCGVSFENPLAFPSCPFSTLLPLSSAFALGWFPVWTVPGKKPLGEQRACWLPAFFSGGSETDTAALATSVSKEGRQACGASPERAQTTFPHGKTIQVCFFRTTREVQSGLQDSLLATGTSKVTPHSSVSSCLWKFRSFSLFRANSAFLVAPPNLCYMRVTHTCMGTPPLGLDLEVWICIMELPLLHRLK